MTDLCVKTFDGDRKRCVAADCDLLSGASGSVQKEALRNEKNLDMQK